MPYFRVLGDTVFSTNLLPTRHSFSKDSEAEAPPNRVSRHLFVGMELGTGEISADVGIAWRMSIIAVETTSAVMCCVSHDVI